MHASLILRGPRCLAVAALAAVFIHTTAAADDWRQVGFFRSDGGNISVGAGHVRVITTVDIPEEIYAPGLAADTAAIAALYPGWDYRGNLELHYGPAPQGWKQVKYLYSLGAERKALPDDTVPATYAVFDIQNTRSARIPDDLHALIGATVPIKAARKGNLDADPAPEWVVVIAAPEADTVRGARMKVSLIDRDAEGWKVMAIFPIEDPSVAGPLEIRDATGDGKPDVVFRTFRETMGHFWIEARIFSTHEGMPSVLNPAPMRPTAAR